MTQPSTLFIPDRFTDYRLWSDIPDRIRDRTEIIYYEQHEEISWDSAEDEFVAAVRRLVITGSFDIVIAAGQAARYAFAVAAAGLAKGVVFFQPWLDRLPDDVDIDFSLIPAETDPYLPIVSAVSEPDPGRQRDVLLNVLRDTAGSDLQPAELQLSLSMLGDHAEEFFADLQAVAAAADGPAVPDPPWAGRPWIDRLASLTVPVTVVVPDRARAIAATIARRAPDAEIIEAAGYGGLAPSADRARSAAALLRLLDRAG